MFHHDAPWVRNAACKGVDTDLFYQESKTREMATAKAICSSCPVQVECLIYAIKRNEQHGIWGGLSTLQREYLRRKVYWRSENDAEAWIRNYLREAKAS